MDLRIYFLWLLQMLLVYETCFQEMLNQLPSRFAWPKHRQIIVSQYYHYACFYVYAQPCARGLCVSACDYVGILCERAHLICSSPCLLISIESYYKFNTLLLPFLHFTCILFTFFLLFFIFILSFFILFLLLINLLILFLISWVRFPFTFAFIMQFMYNFSFYFPFPIAFIVIT